MRVSVTLVALDYSHANRISAGEARAGNVLSNLEGGGRECEGRRVHVRLPSQVIVMLCRTGTQQEQLTTTTTL